MLMCGLTFNFVLDTFVFSVVCILNTECSHKVLQSRSKNHTLITKSLTILWQSYIYPHTNLYTNRVSVVDWEKESRSRFSKNMY